MARFVRSSISRILAAFVVATMGFPMPAAAHTRSESHSAWQISGNVIHLQFTVPDLESQRLTPNGAMPAVADEGKYIQTHVGAFSGENTCEMTEGPRNVGAAAGYRRYEFTFQCPSPNELKVRSSAWFELVNSHTNFAQIQTDTGIFVEQLITADEQTLDVTNSAGGSPLQYASFFDFVGMGIMHIFTGIDHMSFMLGLVLISRRIRDLLFVVTGFTIGHSLTLALAVTGLLRPEAQYIDALVALTIARRRHPGAVPDGHASIYGVSAGFATTLANAAGPVMSSYLLMKRMPKEQLVATGAWFFLTVNVTKLPIYAVNGLLSQASFTFDALMAPVVVCGAFAGFWLLKRIPQQAFDTLMLVLATISALFLFR